jgi:hypothetical protein
MRDPLMCGCVGGPLVDGGDTGTSGGEALDAGRWKGGSRLSLSVVSCFLISTHRHARPIGT